jgi:hypothetical protein
MNSSTRAHILLASMPKSGSTYLSDMIGRLPGFHVVPLIPTAGRREQELDEYCLRRVDPLSYVGPVHVRYSDWTENMRREHQLTPVVLVRNLFDVVVSLRDHMRSEGTTWPMFFAEAHHADLDDAALERMIAQLAIPWYVNFYMGWRQAPGVMMVSYEQLIEAPRQVVNDILGYAGASAGAAHVDAAVARVTSGGKSRLNVGVCGRGAALDGDVVQMILDMLAAYPAAAADPYVDSVKAQGLALLSGTPAQPAIRLAPPRLAVQPRQRRRKSKSLLMTVSAPAALVALALLYWIWPSDLVPDKTRFGYVDDVVVLTLLSVLAGRFTKHKPRLRAPKSLRPAARAAQPQVSVTLGEQGAAGPPRLGDPRKSRGGGAHEVQPVENGLRMLAQAGRLGDRRALAVEQHRHAGKTQGASIRLAEQGEKAGRG